MVFLVTVAVIHFDFFPVTVKLQLLLFSFSYSFKIFSVLFSYSYSYSSSEANSDMQHVTSACSSVQPVISSAVNSIVFAVHFQENAREHAFAQPVSFSCCNVTAH